MYTGRFPRFRKAALLFPFLVSFGMLVTAVSSGNAAQDPPCVECHAERTEGEVVHWAVGDGCNSCHIGTHDLTTNRYPEAQPKGLKKNPPDLCFDCHDSESFSRSDVHPALQKGCTRCHDPHSAPNAGLLKDQDPKLCFGCHQKSGIFEGASVHAAIGLGCTICHSPHSSDDPKLLLAQPPDLCYTCHSPFQGKVRHPPIDLCTSCHNPHASPWEKLLLIEPAKLCRDCHKEKLFDKRYVHGPVSLGLCTACHSPHDAENEKLLLQPDAQLCFICHYGDEFEKKNVHPPVKKGKCIVCHDPHSARGRFQLDGPINGVCGKCHPKVEKQTHVLQGFSAKKHPLKGVADPVRPGRAFACTGCHNPHSSDSIRLFRYPAKKSFDVCVNCHEK